MFAGKRIANAVCPAPLAAQVGLDDLEELLAPIPRCLMLLHNEVVLAVVAGWEPAGLPAGHRRLDRSWLDDRCRRHRSRLLNDLRRWSRNSS